MTLAPGHSATINEDGAPATPEAARSWLWSRPARMIYLVEFLAAAVPIIVLGYSALILGVVGGGAFLVALPTIFDGSTGVDMALFGAFGFGAAILGIVALLRFISVSLRYIMGKTTDLVGMRRAYRQGLACSAFPLIVLATLSAISLGNEQAQPLVLFFFFGGGILMAAVHLGFAVHAARETQAPA